MPENEKTEDKSETAVKDVTKVAEAGKVKKKPMTKVDIKNMSKLEAQKIINEKDPNLLQRIEDEVAAKAKIIKRRVMILGFVVIVVAVAYIVYNQMQKKKKRASLIDASQVESVFALLEK